MTDPTTQRHQSASDAIPPAEPLQGAHATYEKGEVGTIGSLIGDISSDLSTLMRQEVDLAKAEIRQTAGRAGLGAGLLGGAGMAAHFMLLFGSLALWWLLADLMDNGGWAFLLVAVLWGLIALALGLSGRAKLREIQGMPQTVETAKRVPDALKGNE